VLSSNPEQQQQPPPSSASGAAGPLSQQPSQSTHSSALQLNSIMNNRPLDLINHLKKVFDPSQVMPIPQNATSTVYVEGIPLDASEREVAHIFRPF